MITLTFQDRRNFVRSPPTGVSFEFELEAFLPVAQATLAADPNLEKMRFELVPKTWVFMAQRSFKEFRVLWENQLLKWHYCFWPVL